MAVSQEDVARVAELANLELTGEEASRLRRDLNAILEHIAQLNELDTSRVEPMIQAVNPPAAENVSGEPLRADTVSPSLPRDEVLSAAPDTDGVYFRVPKVIER